MRFSTIVIDPPWKMDRPSGWGRGTRGIHDYSMPYKTMSLDRIRALPVSSLCRDVCHLYLWTTSRHVGRAYDLVKEWGFHRSALLTWTKKPRGMGPGGHYASTTEFVIFARRGVEKKNPAKRVNATWFAWPRRKHSEKPQEFYDMVSEISPSPRLDVFARSPRQGWYVWGDEVTATVKLPSLDDWSKQT